MYMYENERLTNLTSDMIDKEIWDLAWEENLVGRTEWHRDMLLDMIDLGFRVQISCATSLRFNRYIYRDDNKKLAATDCARYRLLCLRVHESRIPFAYLWSASLLWQMFNELSFNLPVLYSRKTSHDSIKYGLTFQLL